MNDFANPEKQVIASDAVVTSSLWRVLWLRTFRGYAVTRVSHVPEVGAFGQIRYRKKRILERRP